MSPLESPPDAPRLHLPFFSQTRTFDELWPLVNTHIDHVMNNGGLAPGQKATETERALADRLGARHVIGVGGAADALVLLLRACGIERGDEVIVPALGSATAVRSVVRAGGRPVFADIDPATYTLDPGSVAARITPRARFVVPVHLFCQLADMTALREVARRHGLTVIEDASDAVGMRSDGTHAGLLGAGGALSFAPAATLGALGDAGAVITDDDTIAGTIRGLRRGAMDDIQAAILLAKLTRLDADIARRADLAAAYTDRLRGVPGIVRLPTVKPRAAATAPVFHSYVIEADVRDALADHLSRNGVETESCFPEPPYLQPSVAEQRYRRGDFPRAEAACARALALPLYPDLDLDRVDAVCALIRAFYTDPAGPSRDRTTRSPH